MTDPRPRVVVPVQGGRGVTSGAPPLPAARPAEDDAERFRALFEQSPTGVALCHLDGTFVEVNRTLLDLVTPAGGVPPRRLTDLGRRVSAAPTVPAEGEPWRQWRAALAEVRTGRRPVARAELPVGETGGATRWVRATAALIVLGEGSYLLAHLEDATDRRLAEQRLAHLALHDELTGLANRTLLAERFEAAASRGAGTGLSTGIVYVDLDDFSAVNERFGAPAGDEVLVAVAARLRSGIGAGDTAGRLGADEFVVVAPDVADTAALARLARRVEQALAAPLDLAAGRLRVSASVGVALARTGDTFSAALHRADVAMFSVKRSRRPHARVDLDRRSVVVTDSDQPDLALRIAPQPAPPRRA